MEELRYEAGEAAAGQRLDKALPEAFAELSRSRLQTLLEEGLVTLNGVPANKKTRLAPGDEVVVRLPAVRPAKAQAENLPLTVVYEDESLLVVDKPKGMVVHPAPGSPSGTLVNALLYHCGATLSGIGGEARPGIVHRIDKDTSGLLVVAKTDAAHEALSAQFAAHSIAREYRAVVYGTLREDEGFVEAPIGRDPRDRKRMAVGGAAARDAYTSWRVLERYRNFTYIACRLRTGRTHQIRVHLASCGHPLAGDAVYGPRKAITALGGQCLHAGLLGFAHPATGAWLEFASPLPAYFTRFLAKLEKESGEP